MIDSHDIAITPDGPSKAINTHKTFTQVKPRLYLRTIVLCLFRQSIYGSRNKHSNRQQNLSAGQCRHLDLLSVAEPRRKLDTSDGMWRFARGRRKGLFRVGLGKVLLLFASPESTATAPPISLHSIFFVL